MNAIVVMARKPEPNKVKTRMTPQLEPAIAVELYHAFLLDKIDQISEIQEADHFIAYTPISSLPFFLKISPPDFSLIPQQGTDLGQRLDNVCEYLFNKEFKKVIIIDSDSPNLPTEYLVSGIHELDNADIVIGPCEDGGYYLIGLKERTSVIFQDIPWSTSKVAEITIEKAKSLGKDVLKLQDWYDVDTVEDLIRLKVDLSSMNKDLQDQYRCKNTVNMIKKIFK
jgi:rSAM/selenodomain-associated transferase 1